jgi:hypothetical protein
MRIWCHLALTTAAQVLAFGVAVLASSSLVGLASGQVVTDSRPLQIAAVVVGMLFVFASIYGGIRLAEWLARRVAARCPRCRGAAVAVGHRPIRYACRDCHHVEATSVLVHWGEP